MYDFVISYILHIFYAKQTLGYLIRKWVSRLYSKYGSTPIKGFRMETPGNSSISCKGSEGR